MRLNIQAKSFLKYIYKIECINLIPVELVNINRIDKNINQNRKHLVKHII